MSRIQFERRKRKKGYLVPLVIIVLLYFMIPVFLINKGNDLIAKAEDQMKMNETYSPPVELYNGIAFLNTAAAFPGFGGWSETIEDEVVEEMIGLQANQFKKICLSFVELDDSDSVDVSVNKELNPFVLEIKSIFADSSKTLTIELNDSLIKKIDSAYCQPWTRFFDKTKSDKSRLYSFCKD